MGKYLILENEVPKSHIYAVTFVHICKLSFKMVAVFFHISWYSLIQ